jgi:hypothetical protein
VLSTTTSDKHTYYLPPLSYFIFPAVAIVDYPFHWEERQVEDEGIIFIIALLTIYHHGQQALVVMAKIGKVILGHAK